MPTIKTFRSIIEKNALIIAIIAIIFGLTLIGSSSKIKTLTNQKNTLEAQQAVFTSSESVFRYKNRSFVAHEEGPVDAVIYTATSCDGCAVEIEKILRKLKGSLPTLHNIEIRDTDSGDVQSEALQNNVAFIPSVILSKEVANTKIFSDARNFFSQTKNGGYQVFLQSLGHNPITYIASPKSKAGFSADQSSNATSEIHAFLTTDCPACKTAYNVLETVQKSNPNVKIVYHYSEKRQEKKHNATRSIACAAKTGREKAYTANLYTRQAAWSPIKQLDPIFTRYATANAVPSEEFITCLENPTEDILEIIAKQESLFNTFGVGEVPTIFVNNTVFTGVQTIATIKSALKGVTTTQ